MMNKFIFTHKIVVHTLTIFVLFFFAHLLTPNTFAQSCGGGGSCCEQVNSRISNAPCSHICPVGPYGNCTVCQYEQYCERESSWVCGWNAGAGACMTNTSGSGCSGGTIPAGCSGGGAPLPYCGDGICQGGAAACSTCPQDCGVCPATCGDGACNGGENTASCASDCPGGGGGEFCGNGSCGAGENCSNCPSECGACGGGGGSCGDGVCNGSDNCSSCPGDCGACAAPTYCGDLVCNGSETCSACPGDCGSCGGPFCGDGIPNGFETCLTCPSDVGACATNEGWWQSVGGSVFAGNPISFVIRSLVPSACTAPGCIASLISENSAGDALSDGFPITGGGFIDANGYLTERQPNVEVRGTNISRYQENFSFFYREYSLGSNPVDDFSGSAGNALKPTTSPLSGNTAYYHNSTTNGTFTINTPWNVAANEKIVIFIEGNMNITDTNGLGQMVTVAPGGFVAFIVSGNITIDSTVGNSSLSSTTSNLTGLYLADGNITIVSTDNTATEKRFVGTGTFVGWGGVVLNRDLGASTNTNTPAEQFIFEPALVKNIPAKMARPQYVWQETN